MTTHHRAQTNVTALTEIDLFESCADARLELLRPYTDVIDVPAGDVLDRAGSPARQFIGILDGYVERVSADGRATVMGRGEWIGAFELLGRLDHRSTFVAHTAATLVVVFGPPFRAAMRHDAGVIARAASRYDAPAARVLSAVA